MEPSKGRRHAALVPQPARRLLCRCFGKAERACRRLRRAMEREWAATNAGTPGQPPLDGPPSAREWEAFVHSSGPVTPVQTIDSRVAIAMVAVANVGESLLEVGCGTARASAQLGLHGCEIHLADFSRPILERACELFAQSSLAPPTTVECDITRGIPLPDGAVDVVWSSGLLEHWPDDEVEPMLREMRRVARRAVVSFVPNAHCLLYMAGKAVAEQTGGWPYGRELPRTTLVPVFQNAGLHVVSEQTLDAAQGLEIVLLDQAAVLRHHAELRAELDRLHHLDAAFAAQGYLLMTVGLKEPVESIYG